MLINIRGTSGSGKSSLVREIIARYATVEHFKPEGIDYPKERRQPWAYRCRMEDAKHRELMILGHYETACGGCDTLAPMDFIFNFARLGHTLGYDVLFEGLLISADFNRTVALHNDGLPLIVIGLDLPLDVCTASIEERRERGYQERLRKAQEAGKPAPKRPKPLNAANTESKWKGTRSTMRKLQEAGATAEWHDRDSALERIIGALDL